MSLITNISSKEFDEWQVPSMKVIVHEHPRRFASVRLAEAPYDAAVCWQSDIVEPVIIRLPGRLWVGVDQRVVCLSDTGLILFSVALHTRLLDLQVHAPFLVVLCESEVMTVNDDFSIRAFHSLADVPAGIAIVDSKLVVTLDDGTTVTLAN